MEERQQKEREMEERRHERIARNIQLHPPRELPTRRQESQKAVREQEEHDRAQREEEQQRRRRKRRVSTEQKDEQQRKHSRQPTSSRASRHSSSSSSPSSAAVSRRLADYRHARVLIVGAGPAALAAACQLADEGYYDVVMLEARDRMGGRVHTIDLERLAQQRLRLAQHTADAESEARLQRLLACPQLSVVDEGAAFVHGYNSRNRVTHYIPAQHTHLKSEYREQWRDNGQPVDSERINEARRIYSFVDHTVLQTLTQCVAQGRMDGNVREEKQQLHDSDGDNSRQQEEEATEDVSFGQCFDAALAGLWERKQRKWQTDVDGEEEDETWIREQEEYARRLEARGGKIRGKRRRDERQPLSTIDDDTNSNAPCTADADDTAASAAAGSTVGSAPIDAPVQLSTILPSPPLSPPLPLLYSSSSSVPSLSPSSPSTSCPPSARWTLADRECDMELKKRVLAAVRVSQHCYVAEDSQLSAFDLLQCAKEPPLSHPEVIPLSGYSELIDAMLHKLQQWRRDFWPQLNTRVLAVEEKTVHGTAHRGGARDGEQEEDSHANDASQPMNKKRRTKKKTWWDQSGSGQGESSYVELTVMTKGDDGAERETKLVGDYCIVTVPLGVLKHPSRPVRFVPPLSAVFPVSTESVSRQDCIDGLAMGCENKVVLCWAEQWWTKYITPALSVEAAADRALNEPVQYFRSTAHPYIKVLILPNMCTSQHTLVMHFAPPEAYRIGDMSDAAASSEAMRILRHMFQPAATDSEALPLPEPDLAFVSRWHADPYCYGSYSYVPVGGSNHCSTLLAERSAHSRVLFAGEHCAGRDLQTVHGALASGEVAAKQVRLLVQANGMKEAEHRVCRLSAHATNQASSERSASQPIRVTAADDEEEAMSAVEREDDECEQAPLSTQPGDQQQSPGYHAEEKMEADETKEHSPTRAQPQPASDSSTEEVGSKQGTTEQAGSLHHDDVTADNSSPASLLLTSLSSPVSARQSDASSGSNSTRNGWLRSMDEDGQADETGLPLLDERLNTHTMSRDRQQGQVRRLGRARTDRVASSARPMFSTLYPHLHLQQQSVSA